MILSFKDSKTGKFILYAADSELEKRTNHLEKCMNILITPRNYLKEGVLLNGLIDYFNYAMNNKIIEEETYYNFMQSEGFRRLLLRSKNIINDEKAIKKTYEACRNIQNMALKICCKIHNNDKEALEEIINDYKIMNITFFSD